MIQEVSLMPCLYKLETWKTIIAILQDRRAWTIFTKSLKDEKSKNYDEDFFLSFFLICIKP